MGFNKNKHRRNPFILIEKRLIESAVWAQIKQVGRDIYVELKRNFNGFNNGQLICCYTFMRKKYGYGYGTLHRGFKKLEELELIKMTERGELAGLSGKKANKYLLIGKHERIIEEKS